MGLKIVRQRRVAELSVVRDDSDRGMSGHGGGAIGGRTASTGEFPGNFTSEQLDWIDPYDLPPSPERYSPSL